MKALTAPVRACILAVLMAVTCGACALDQVTNGQDDRVTDAQARRARWMNERPRYYAISYLLIEGGPGTPEAYRYVTVRNNSVLDTTCPDAKCPVAQLRDLRQVHELFDLALDQTPNCESKVIYRNDINVPSLITRSCKPGAGVDYSIAVTLFSILN
jgi:hypothetical protein